MRVIKNLLPTETGNRKLIFMIMQIAELNIFSAWSAAPLCAAVQANP